MSTLAVDQTEREEEREEKSSNKVANRNRIHLSFLYESRRGIRGPYRRPDGRRKKYYCSQRERETHSNTTSVQSIVQLALSPLFFFFFFFFLICREGGDDHLFSSMMRSKKRKRSLAMTAASYPPCFLCGLTWRQGGLQANSPCIYFFSSL